MSPPSLERRHPSRGGSPARWAVLPWFLRPWPKGKRSQTPSTRLYVYPFGPYPMLGGRVIDDGQRLVWAYEKLAGARNWTVLRGVRCSGAGDEPAGADGLCFIPYLAGERNPYWSDDIRGGFHGLQLTHDQRHLVRAVMEGVAYSLRTSWISTRIQGCRIQRDCSGRRGATATQGWPQILADVCQRDVLIYAGKETVTRVSMPCARNTWAAGDSEKACCRRSMSPTVMHPRPSLQRTYEEGYRALPRHLRSLPRRNRPDGVIVCESHLA